MAPHVAAQPPALPPRLVLLQQLVWSSYPDLQRASLQARILPSASSLTLELAVAAEPTRRTAAPRRAPDLVVEAAFDAQDRLTQLTATGLRAHDPERATLARAPQADLARALRRAGAAFPPDDATAAGRLPLGALTPALGPLTATGATFETSDPATRLRWRVAATAADGATVALLFEPLEGRLVGLTRLGGVQ